MSDSNWRSDLRVVLRAVLVSAGVACLSGAGSTVRAQEARLAAALGSRVRVTRCEAVAAPCDRTRRVDGILLAEDVAGVALQTADTTVHVPWEALRRVETYEGSRGALRTVGFALGGLLLGSVAGIAAGALIQGECYELGCLEGPAIGFLVGAPVGLAGGITLAVTTRERWRTAYEIASQRGAAPPWGRPAAVGVAVRLPVTW